MTVKIIEKIKDFFFWKKIEKLRNKFELTFYGKQFKCYCEFIANNEIHAENDGFNRILESLMVSLPDISLTKKDAAIAYLQALRFLEE